MDNFLNEGGYLEDKKKQKKLEEAAERQTEVEEEEEEEKDTEADDQMSGYMYMTKSKLDQKTGIDLTNIVGDVGGLAKNAFNLVGNAINKGKFYAIKKGILYEYKNEKSRDCESKINICKIGAIDKNYQNDKQFQMMYRSFFITLDCEDKWRVEKWINSLKLVKENPDEYADIHKDHLFSGDTKKEDKYVGTGVYSKVTVKSCFKDYDVLCEEYEHKIMLQIYLKSQKHLALHKKAPLKAVL